MAYKNMAKNKAHNKDLSRVNRAKKKAVKKTKALETIMTLFNRKNDAESCKTINK